MTSSISRICRYPVKGLSPDEMKQATVEAGGGLNSDRRFAFALGSTRFEDGKPHWLPKTSFLALMKNEKLAALDTRFDEATNELTIFRDGKQVKRGNMSDPLGRALLEDFFAAYMKDECRGKPQLVEAKDEVVFSDQKTKVISLINLASVRDFERVVSMPLDPIRFRGNIYIDGLDPWKEFEWCGKDIQVGSVTLSVTEHIDRCAAINVDPSTGERDRNLVKELQRGFGHVNMGVFATVKTGGSFAVGDEIKD
ncbi:MAG: MOSC domain-containing protein [Rhodospirillaceae bacterium]|jgi:uncharacterized protein|nr:MOSC domain-containing protein [Rhodospirillaceae bacterium]MBT4464618.1 MOSC domain-containing protein [Rhodospirillaceae bacterium]MBT5014362.1 MOSC domain-containing protein [Rhodospirillaceae bacterium]MBT6405983.1 MOSC domain-containing protein [Rhodospirillaceae bacterium]MBT7357091.1 MOSC domain-containing protein [Rhodospirillaceae bacterium]